MNIFCRLQISNPEASTKQPSALPVDQPYPKDYDVMLISFFLYIYVNVDFHLTSRQLTSIYIHWDQ